MRSVEVPNIIKENNMVSPLNIINPFARGMSRGAFHGEMNCPFCSANADPTTTPIGFENKGKSKFRFVENVGPFIRVYKCKKCNGQFRYDVTNGTSSPYDSFKKGLKLPGLGYSGRVPNIG